MEYEEKIVKVAVLPKGEPIFCENAFSVEIDDEAAGEFLVVRTNLESCKEGEIRICAEEWPVLRTVIDRLILECRV